MTRRSQSLRLGAPRLVLGFATVYRSHLRITPPIGETSVVSPPPHSRELLMPNSPVAVRAGKCRMSRRMPRGRKKLFLETGRRYPWLDGPERKSLVQKRRPWQNSEGGSEAIFPRLAGLAGQ